jgi:sugar/nucleoside kinase (ribokinase family)
MTLTPSTSHSTRAGIASGGNWIVDWVKTVDRLPGRGMLGNVQSQARSTGGAPANVLMDLARLQFPFPLTAAGVVGNDSDGAFLRETARSHGIDVAALAVTREAPTSYTDVMAEQGSGDRSFFHCRGANALFGPEHVNVASLTCRIFHLGYLLLLDRMDQPHVQHGTVAAAFLKALQAAGIKTSVDVVSEESDRFRTLVPPALRYTDYLILNEVEAARAVGRTVRTPEGRLDGAALAGVVDELYRFGDMELVAVHMPEGVYLRDRAGQRTSLGSFLLPEGFLKGALGAGDAFCAGMLYGLHEGWAPGRCAELGICCATACLADPTATGGMAPLDEALRFAERFPRRPPPV